MYIKPFITKDKCLIFELEFGFNLLVYLNLQVHPTLASRMGMLLFQGVTVAPSLRVGTL